MSLRRTIIVVLLFATAFAAPSIGTAADNTCTPVDGAKVCVEDFSVSKGMLLTGEQANLSITVENRGHEPATAVVTLNTAGPNNTTGVYPIGNPTLMPGENQTITQELNGSTPGAHGFRVLVTDAETQKRYDVSDIETIEVREEPPVRLGGRWDRSETALVALLISLSGLGVLGYCQRGT